MSAAARVAVIDAARDWIGTPFHDMARVKGVGCDCAQLVAAAFQEAGVLPYIETGAYAPQFMLHSRDEKLVEFILRYGREIDEATVGMADVVVYRVGRSYSHAAIVVDWPGAILHAHKLSGQVVEMDGRTADLAGRATRFFSVF